MALFFAPLTLHTEIRVSCLPDLGPGIGGLEPGQPRPGAERLSENQQEQATHHNGQLCDPEDKFRNG